MLLKGVAYLVIDLYCDPAARVIGDIDLLVPSDQLAAAVGALSSSGYQEVGFEDFSFAGHHHYTPLARRDAVAKVELHADPVRRTFSRLLPTERVRQDARRLSADGPSVWLPSPQGQIVHNIVHTQLADRNYWSGRISLRDLSDLARLRSATDGEIDWRDAQWPADVDRPRILVRLHADQGHQALAAGAAKRLDDPAGLDPTVGFVDCGDAEIDAVTENATRLTVERDAVQGRKRWSWNACS